MKRAILVLASMVSLAACVMDDPEATESQQVQPTTGTPTEGDTSRFTTCSTRSIGFCSGQSIGTTCNISPRRWCLPANELPNGEIFCLCQAQTTI